MSSITPNHELETVQRLRGLKPREISAGLRSIKIATKWRKLEDGSWEVEYWDSPWGHTRVKAPKLWDAMEKVLDAVEKWAKGGGWEQPEGAK